MIIDLNRCIGCHSCEVACKLEHNLPKDVSLTKVVKYEEGIYPNARMYMDVKLCMHCDNPPCVEICPTGASIKLDNGIVYVDYDKCIGCKNCIMVCPYDARTYVNNAVAELPGISISKNYGKNDDLENKVMKCDFCFERIKDNKLPACVIACPAKARVFGDLDDPNSEVSELIQKHETKNFPFQQNTNPGIRYIKQKNKEGE